MHGDSSVGCYGGVGAVRHLGGAVSRGTSVHWAGGRRHGVQFTRSGGVRGRSHIRQVKAQSSKGHRRVAFCVVLR